MDHSPSIMADDYMQFGSPDSFDQSLSFCTVGCCEEVTCFKTFMYDSEGFSASKRA